MARALVRHVAPQVRSQEDGAAERGKPAVVTSRHAWQRAGVRLVTAGSCGLDRVAPHPAQKHGVVTYAGDQRDRKNGCSKHVGLGVPRGQELRQLRTGSTARNPSGSCLFWLGRRNGPAGFRQRSAENSAVRLPCSTKRCEGYGISRGTEAADTGRRPMWSGVADNGIAVELLP